MRKKYLWLCIPTKSGLLSLIGILTSFLANSQITITQSDMPSVGDTLRVSITNTIGTLSPDSTGANYAWDFTSLSPNSQDVEHFLVPSTTGYLILPYMSSYGYKTNKIDTTNRIDFFKKSSSCYRQMGYGQKLGGFPAPIIYSPADTVYTFPMNFGNSDSCTSGYSLPIPGIGSYSTKTKRVNMVDGWGTLQTPCGTFQTLRVKATLYRTDSIYIDTLNFGFSIPLPPQYEYKWLGQGEKIPLLLIVANDIAGFPVVTSVTYRDSMRAGVTQVAVEEIAISNFDFQVYPNPAHELVFVPYFLEGSENVKIELYDLTGKKVCDVSDKKQSEGQHIEVINLREKNLQSGIYFLKIQSGNKSGSCKLVIQ